MTAFRYICILSVPILVFVILMGFNRKFFSYLIKSWPEIAVNLIIVVVTLVIAFIIFSLEARRSVEFQKENFKRTFAALVIESGRNYGKVNSLLSSISASPLTNFNLAKLDTSIAQSALSNPLLYKYAGIEFFTAVSMYIHQAAITNRILDLAYQEFLNSKTINSGMQKDLLGKLEDTKKYILIFQISNEGYNIGYNANLGPSSGLKYKIDSWLKSNPSIDELESELAKFRDMAENERAKLRRSLEKALDH